VRLSIDFEFRYEGHGWAKGEARKGRKKQWGDVERKKYDGKAMTFGMPENFPVPIE
jgi:hypothetical protein